MYGMSWVEAVQGFRCGGLGGHHRPFPARAPERGARARAPYLSYLSHLTDPRLTSICRHCRPPQSVFPSLVAAKESLGAKAPFNAFHPKVRLFVRSFVVPLVAVHLGQLLGKLR
jgi:hypothetical protein